MYVKLQYVAISIMFTVFLLIVTLASVFVFIEKDYSILKEDDLVLKQVFILSRHGIRTPLANNLKEVTPKTWPEWTDKPGFLTQKGALMEGYMGNYISEWLKEQEVLATNCPREKEVFIYVNVKQRTRASGEAFVKNAFPNCNVTIHHSDSNDMDPIFNPVIHNSSIIFKKLALKEMRERLKSLHLNSSYTTLSNILDYKHSTMCEVHRKCNLTSDVNKIINIEIGLKPNILGPLKISNSAIDAFIMEYYEGFPQNQVAWGTITQEKWREIMLLSRGYHNVIFNTTLIAKDISEPLLHYMRNIFINDNTTKLTLLMGHDANIYTLLEGMSFKTYFLPKQYELTPVSGKIVFQKWVNRKNQVELLKVSYVYQSTEQLRDGLELSLKNPPLFQTLEMVNCKAVNGFCLWSDFIKFLKNL